MSGRRSKTLYFINALNSQNKQNEVVFFPHRNGRIIHYDIITLYTSTIQVLYFIGVAVVDKSNNEVKISFFLFFFEILDDLGVNYSNESTFDGTSYYPKTSVTKTSRHLCKPLTSEGKNVGNH